MVRLLVCLAVLSLQLPLASRPLVSRPQAVDYSLTANTADASALEQRYSAAQVGILEKLNRVDRDHFSTLDSIVVSDVWPEDELTYSPFPAWYDPGSPHARLLIVHQPAQAFAGYEYGELVRWGPISSGRRTRPTPNGVFFLNWKSPGRVSTVNTDWFMRWYFNFHNARGLSLHQHPLPGYPASYACVRLLERDAIWLFHWGEGWTLDEHGGEVLQTGTPVVVVGQYDFDAPPLWRSLQWLAEGVTDLPLALHLDQSR